MKRLQVQHLVKESIQEFMCIVCVYLSLGTYPFINDMIMRKKFKTKLCPMLYIIVLGSVATLSTTCCTELSFVIWPPWVRSKVGVSWRSRGLILTLDPNAESVDPGQRWANTVFWTEYEYEWYSESEFWPNTNTNNIRFFRMSEYEYE